MASENQGGSPSPASSRAVSAAQKQLKALELRRAGAGFEKIAQQLGYSSAGGAYKAVQAGIKKLLREPGESVRKLELDRLDRLMVAIWLRAMNGDLGALDRVLKISISAVRSRVSMPLCVSSTEGTMTHLPFGCRKPLTGAKFRWK